MGELPKLPFTTRSMPKAITAIPASMSATRPAMNSAARGAGRDDGWAAPERSRPIDLPLVRISFPRLIFDRIAIVSPSSRIRAVTTLSIIARRQVRARRRTARKAARAGRAAIASFYECEWVRVRIRRIPRAEDAP